MSHDTSETLINCVFISQHLVDILVVLLLNDIKFLLPHLLLSLVKFLY
jgi:hypothetical protein